LAQSILWCSRATSRVAQVKGDNYRDKQSKRVRRTGLILVFVVGEVGQRRRSVDGLCLERRHFRVNGSVLAFPHGERLELTSIGSTPSGGAECLDGGANRAIAAARSLRRPANARSVERRCCLGCFLRQCPSYIAAKAVRSVAAWVTQSCSH
jgi:hypothetical protein